MGLYRIGVDIGGTFTDIVALNEETGEIKYDKVLTTPEDQTIGFMDVIAKVGIPFDEIKAIGHGTTVGINAILTRKGDKTGLLANEGFRDNLDWGRIYRPWGKYMYDPTWQRPHVERPLIKRKHRRGIPGRIKYDGTVFRPLDEEAVRRETEFLKSEGVVSIAICFVNSYLNLEHEKRAKEIVKEVFPEAYVQNSELHCVVREYQRTVTVVLDAYIGKLVSSYLSSLKKRLNEAGYRGDIFIMQVSGGFAKVEAIIKAPVYTLMSGPVGGLLGGQYYSEELGRPNVICFDMGGTTTDVSVVLDGKVVGATELEIEHAISAWIPVLEVKSIGSGGGSQIYLDVAGALHVGPESSGGKPGPVCYKLGGTIPCLTDAHVVLGNIQTDMLLGGEMELDAQAATNAIKSVADQLKLSPEELSQGVIKIANANMSETIRTLSTYRGLDPRNFVLLAYGSAGPLHAAAVAKDLRTPEVIIPIGPGCFSAFGLVAADLKVTCAESIVKPIEAIGPVGFNEVFQRLEERVKEDLELQGAEKNRIKIERNFYGMYFGQTWDNLTPAPPGVYDEKTMGDLRKAFDENYLKAFGYNTPELPVIITDINVTGYGLLGHRKLREIAKGKAKFSGDAILSIRRVYLEGKWQEIPFYDREKLLSNNVIEGPAVVVEKVATTVLNKGDIATVDRWGNLIIKIT